MEDIDTYKLVATVLYGVALISFPLLKTIRESIK